MKVVSTSEWVHCVIGQYLADTKGNEANIMKHMIYHNTEELRN